MNLCINSLSADRYGGHVKPVILQHILFMDIVSISNEVVLVWTQDLTDDDTGSDKGLVSSGTKP